MLLSAWRFYKRFQRRIQFVNTLLYCCVLAAPQPPERVQITVIKKVHKGLSSYYGNEIDGLVGRKMASGKILEAGMLICAHKTLPFGTMLRVINPSNGLFVDLPVLDRGPFVKGRSLDISAAAAEIIGLSGVKRVIFQEIKHEWVSIPDGGNQNNNRD